MPFILKAFIWGSGIVLLGVFLSSIFNPNNQAAISVQDATPAKQVQPANTLRRLTVKSMEDNLLRAGFDVQVSYIEEDDSKLLIYGKSVNRPFAHNLMAQRDFQKILRSAKFTQVTFMDSLTFPSFVQDYAVH